MSKVFQNDIEAANREIAYLKARLGTYRGQIRRLLAGGREYSHGDLCVWCSEFWESRKHGPECEAKKAARLLAEKV